MRLGKGLLLVLLIAVLLCGCLVTTGDIQGNRFFVEQGFSVGMLDGDWEPVRQQRWVDGHYIRRVNTDFAISFRHKKSNGFIGAQFFVLDDVGKARSLDVWAEGMVAKAGGLKLSQKSIKINGVDAVDVVVSGNYMSRLVILKKDDYGYFLLYSNVPSSFDEYLGTFNKFLETFKTG